MDDILLFSVHAVGFLMQASQGVGDSWKELVNKLEDDLKLVKEIIVLLEYVVHICYMHSSKIGRDLSE